MPSARAAFFMAANTKLTRSEYKEEVNKWIKKNPKKFEELRKSTKNKPWPAVQKLLESKLGKPYWTEVKGSRKDTGNVPKKGEKGFDFTIYNEGGKAGFKSNSTRKATRGNLQYRANQADKSISKEEYIAIGKKHGYSEAEAIKQYEVNEAKLKKLRGTKKTYKGTPLAYEHLTPNASKAYGGLEHWRNIGLLGDPANNKKSDFLITKKTAKKSGIPLTKEEAVLMDLRGDKAVAAGQVRRNIEADLTSRDPVRARTRNKYVSSRQAPNKLKLKTKNGKNGENGDYTNGRTNGGYSNGKVNGGKTNGKFNTDLLGAASKTRTVDALANIGANAATGNYAAVGVGGGALIMTQALQNKKTQQALGKQIGQLVGKRAGRSMMKAVPGLDVFLSGQETVDYLKQGKLDQAGIAALSGAIGWIPIIGDGISASLDLTNTGIDISRLQVPTGTSKKKGVKGTTRRLKFST